MKTAVTAQIIPAREAENSELLFDEPPSSVLRGSFERHLNKTQQPESFSGLSWTKPPDDLKGSVIVYPFEIDRNRRKDTVRCCNCDGREKFLDGMLIWSPDGKIRLIGNKCARRINTDTAEDMMAAHKRKRNEEADTRFLENNLKLIPIIHTQVLRLLQPCSQIMENRKKLQSVPLKDLQRLIKIAFKDQGRLIITRHSEEAGKDIDEPIHTLMGKELFRDPFRLEREYREIQEFFSLHLRDSEDEYMEFLITMLNDMTLLRETANGYRKYYNCIPQLVDKMKNAISFFSPENLNGLKKYGTNRLGDVPFQVFLNKDEVTIRLSGEVPVKFQVGVSVPELSLPELKR